MQQIYDILLKVEANSEVCKGLVFVVFSSIITLGNALSYLNKSKEESSFSKLEKYQEKYLKLK